MPSFNPFSVSSRNVCSLFEIRLDSDFIVLRGAEHEAAGQFLRGEVVLCLREPLKIEDVHLRLTGNCRIAWLDTRQTPTGMHNQKVDRTFSILSHSWPPFVGGNNTPQTLAPGNYEWPFELLLPGDTAESVEGLPQTGISYSLKATVSRGKLAKNLHAVKRLRVIRTLETAALEFNHAMSVENIWPNKIEYSVVIPQKAIVFGSSLPLEMRFSPLLKGLDMGDITVKLVEIHEFSLQGYSTLSRSYKTDREVTTWKFALNREEHWHDNIEETGQEGWAINKELPMPKRLTTCVQDCGVHGIKIRHKVKMTVALKNPDGHISELRATLPVTVFISPNMPIDEEGNLLPQAPGTAEGTSEVEAVANIAPPGYGQHVLDQLYEDIDPAGIMTPAGAQSGWNSPFYGHSRAGSSENLAQLAISGAVPPAALSSRLQNVSLDASHRTSSYTSMGQLSGTNTPFHHYSEGDHTAESSQPQSTELSRQNSGEDHSGHSTPEHVDHLNMEELSKVPSYTTATRAPLPRTSSFQGSLALPDYETALTAPSSPTRNPTIDPMTTISEASLSSTEVPDTGRSRSSSREGRSSTFGFNYLTHNTVGDGHGERRLRLIQERGGA